LYQETCRVIHNPEEYTTQGRPDLLTQEDKDFMTELIDTNPGLFLDKICDQVYNNSGTTVSIETIHYCLTRELGMTLKKAEVYNV
jgi:transposase